MSGERRDIPEAERFRYVARDKINAAYACLRKLGFDLDDMVWPPVPDEPPPPPPDPFTLRTEIDCAVIDDRLSVYDAFNPDNGQGPRQQEQLVVVDEGQGSFLRFNSCPMPEGFEVWNTRERKMQTFPAGMFASAGAMIERDFGSILYGAVEVECKATQASDGTRIAILLWPDGPPAWPSRELDFAEVSGDGDDRTRQVIGLNSHYKDATGKHMQHQLVHEVDWLTWRTIRVEWTPGLIRWLIDGELVGFLTEDVPDAPMFPCIQTALQGADSKGYARKGTTPGGVDVRAWRVYEWTPAP